MPRIKLRRPRGPMSAAQKLALKKAQEASARARRGTGKDDEPKRPRGKAKSDKTPSLKVSNKVHADDTKRRSGRVTLPELARRSLSTPNTKGPARKLSEYQKTDEAIFKDYNKKLASLEDDYNSNRITKRQFTLRKNRLAKELRDKRDANIKKHDRDERGNPKSDEDDSKRSKAASEPKSLGGPDIKKGDRFIYNGKETEVAEVKKRIAQVRGRSKLFYDLFDKDGKKLTHVEEGGTVRIRPQGRKSEGVSKAKVNAPKPNATIVPGGDRDVSKRSVSGLKKERQELHAKIKAGNASDEDKAYLKDVQLELKNRGLNRQNEQTQKPSAAKKKSVYEEMSDSELQETLRDAERSADEASRRNSGTPRMQARHSEARKKLENIRAEVKRRQTQKPSAAKEGKKETAAEVRAFADKWEKASEEAEKAGDHEKADKYHRRAREHRKDARELEAKDPSKYRQSATPTKSDPKVKAEIFRENQGTQIRDDIYQARKIAKEVIGRDNVVAELDTASNSRQLLDAYKGILHYLDEAKQYGPLTAREKQAYERISKAIGRINMKYGGR